MNNNPIGIFDSGVGGLSVFSKLIKLLPNENYIYFGDTKNLPYGNKTQEELIDIVKNIFDFFEEKQTKAVIMACNTTSAIVYDVLKDKYKFRIYPIVQTASKYIASQNYSSVGIFATNATINSHAYQKSINAYNNKIKVFEIPCPDWANIVEMGLQNRPENKENIKKIVLEMLKNTPDKIILGCTHYPYLTDILAECTDRNVFIDPAEYFAKYIADDIKALKLDNITREYEPQFFVSSDPEQFIKSSELFFKVENPKLINILSNSYQTF